MLKSLGLKELLESEASVMSSLSLRFMISLRKIQIIAVSAHLSTS
jgi:hypothetical protein